MSTPPTRRIRASHRVCVSPFSPVLDAACGPDCDAAQDEEAFDRAQPSPTICWPHCCRCCCCCCCCCCCPSLRSRMTTLRHKSIGVAHFRTTLLASDLCSLHTVRDERLHSGPPRYQQNSHQRDRCVRTRSVRDGEARTFPNCSPVLRALWRYHRS